MRLPYGPEPDSPVRFTFNYALVVLSILVLLGLLFIISPNGPLLVVLLALLFLVAVFGGVGFVLTRRGLRQAPGRNVPRP